MIEKAKEKMRAEGEINIFTPALADKIMAFHKVHMSTCDKGIMVRREYRILQFRVQLVFRGHMERDRFWYKSYIHLSILIPT